MTEKDAAIVEHIRKAVGTPVQLTADGMQIFLHLMILDELKAMRNESAQLRGAEVVDDL